MKVIVTGASGYIGSRLVQKLLLNGCKVISATREKPKNIDMSWEYFDLTAPEKILIPHDADVIFHLAAITTSNNESAELERLSANILISQCAERKARLIFISSQTASMNAPTSYGRVKWKIEQNVLAFGGTVVRPGQVYGGIAGGLFGALIKFVKNSIFLPNFIPQPLIQPIHIDDLVECLIRISKSKNISSKIFQLADPNPIRFADFLNQIAKTRVRALRLFFPIPVVLLKLAHRIANAFTQKTIGLERLQSLFTLPLMQTEMDLKALDIQLRPLFSGMSRSGSIDRRLVLLEGYALIFYIGRTTPKGGVLRAYTRAIFSLRNGKPLNFPKIMVRFPVLVSLIENGRFSDPTVEDEFNWRLDAATAFAEFSVPGANTFLAPKFSLGALTAFFNIVTFLFLGCIWRLLGLVLYPFPVLIPQSIVKE